VPNAVAGVVRPGPGWGPKCSAVPSKMLGFIFFEFFSNLGGTGCRRGRTPERPLRQPFQGLADCQASFFGALAGDFRRLQRSGQSSREQAGTARGTTGQISQIDLANCCAEKKFRSTVDLGSFPFRYKRAGAERRGKTSGASDVPLRSRVRSPSSAGRHPCRDRPGRSGGGETIGSLSRQERESPGG
jgi:hypothetical protein